MLWSSYACVALIFEVNSMKGCCWDRAVNYLWHCVCRCRFGVFFPVACSQMCYFFGCKWLYISYVMQWVGFKALSFFSFDLHNCERFIKMWCLKVYSGTQFAFSKIGFYFYHVRPLNRTFSIWCCPVNMILLNQQRSVCCNFYGMFFTRYVCMLGLSE